MFFIVFDAFHSNVPCFFFFFFWYMYGTLVALIQWFSNLSEVSNPAGVMQAYIEPLIITRSGSRKF